MSAIANGTMVKNLPAKARDSGDTSSIPGSGSPLEKEMATHSSNLVWKIPWTEELASSSPWGLKESDFSSYKT